MDVKNITRNHNNLSFVDRLGSFIINNEFSKGYKEFKTSEQETKTTAIWNALSAIGGDYAKTIYSNVLNYLDNVSNVDLCKIKSLYSMILVLGIDFNPIGEINSIPIEILNLLDILTVNKSYLLKSRVFSEEFRNELSTFNNGAISSCIDKAEITSTLSLEIADSIKDSLPTEEMSSYVGVSSYTEVSNILNDDSYTIFLKSIFYSTLTSMVFMKYTDAENGLSSAKNYIYEYISDKLLEDLNLESDTLDEYDEKIKTLKYRYKLGKEFDTTVIMDNIENDLDSFDNYNVYEQEVLKLEIQRREDTYTYNKTYVTSEKPLGFNLTRYSYYREKKVKEYFNYIETTYNSFIQQADIILSVEDTKQQVISTYDKDHNYFNIDLGEIKRLLAYDEIEKATYINVLYIDTVATLLTNLTLELAEIREMIKILVRKDYIKGTFLLLSYLINEYLKHVISNQYGKLFYDEDGKSLKSYIDSSIANGDNVELIEYLDGTEYYNITTDTDIHQQYNIRNYSSLNPKFWDNEDNKIGQDTEDLPLAEIEDFYLELLKLKNNSVDNLVNFLSCIYEIGTPRSYLYNNKTYDFTCLLTNGCWIHTLDDLDPEIYSQDEILKYTEEYNLKKEQFLKYSGTLFGVDPFYNYKNITHSSYQIHPYLYNFIEKSNSVYPLANTFYLIFSEDYEQELIEIGLDEIIGKYGNPINLWKYDMLDWTGYESKFEHDLNLLDLNQTMLKEYQGYTGLFYPPALEQFLTDTETFILNLLDNTDDSYYKHLNLTDVEIDRIVQLVLTYGDLIRTIALAVKGSSSSQHNKLNEFDIYKYAEDAYGNQIFLLKSYLYLYDKNHENPAYEPDYFDKRNAPGELWMRIKNHPLAFPAFDLNQEHEDISQYRMFDSTVKPIEKYHEYLHDISEFYDKTDHVIYSHKPKPFGITQDTLYDATTNPLHLRIFFDMEMEPSNRGILLNVALYQTGTKHTETAVNDPSDVTMDSLKYYNSSVIVAALELKFDYNNQKHVYYFKPDPVDNNDNIKNPMSGKLLTASLVQTDSTDRVAESREESYDFVGFVRTTTYTYAMFVERYNATSYGKIYPTLLRSFKDPNYHHDLTPYLHIKYTGYKYSTKYTTGSSTIALPYDILLDYSNPNSTNIAITMSNKTMTIAFATEKFLKTLDYSDNTEVVNYIEYTALVEEKKDITTYGTNLKYPRNTAILQTTDSLHINIYNSFDSFTSYLMTVEYRFARNKFTYNNYKLYNVNSDIGFMPLFNDRSGTSRIYKNESLKQDIYNLELLGPEQSDVDFTPVITGPSDEKYGRVTEDYQEYNKFYGYSPELTVLANCTSVEYTYQLEDMFGKETWENITETNELMRYKYLLFNSKYPALPICKGSLSARDPEKYYYMASEIYDLLSGQEILGPNGVTFLGVNMTNHINNISAVNLHVNYNADTLLPDSVTIDCHVNKVYPLKQQVIPLSTFELLVYCKNNVKSYDYYHIMENANSGKLFEQISTSQLSTIDFAKISELSSYVLEGTDIKPFAAKNENKRKDLLSADLEFKYSEDETINREFPYLDAADIEDEITIVENEDQYIYFYELDGFDDVDKEIFTYKIYDPSSGEMINSKVNTTSGKYKQFYLSALTLETTYNVENVGTDDNIQYGIVLYVNYKNYTNPLYIEGTSWENYRVAPSNSDNIKGTYLRLLPGKTGSVDIRLDFLHYSKIHDDDIGQTIVGKESKIVTTYYVMNVSDNKPKFLISHKPFSTAKSNVSYDDSYLKQLSSIGDTYVYRGSGEAHKRVYGTLTDPIIETIR